VGVGCFSGKAVHGRCLLQLVGHFAWRFLVEIVVINKLGVWFRRLCMGWGNTMAIGYF